MPVDHWFYSLFQSTPNLIALRNEVIWISLEELGQQDQLDPLLNLLRLPVLLQPELQLSSQQILERRPDLAEAVFSLSFPYPDETAPQRHPEAADGGRQDSHPGAASLPGRPGVACGRPPGRGSFSMTLRLLTHRCGPLSPATTARIQALGLAVHNG